MLVTLVFRRMPVTGPHHDLGQGRLGDRGRCLAAGLQGEGDYCRGPWLTQISGQGTCMSDFGLWDLAFDSETWEQRA